MTDDVMRDDAPINCICLQMMINVHNTSWHDYQNRPSVVLPNRELLIIKANVDSH